MSLLFRRQTLWEARWIVLIIFALGVLFLFVNPWLLFLNFGLLLFTLWFFRDPDRVIAKDPFAIVAPADGLITDIVEEHELPDGTRGIRVSIFLSIFDVHVNRSPVDGRILDRRAFAGRHLDARRSEAHRENEAMLWEIEVSEPTPPGTKVWVRQISGAIARRIVAWRQPGDFLEKGERFGMIRFGSRTDLLLPKGVVVVVSQGQQVRGGATVLARWSPRFIQQIVE